MTPPPESSHCSDHRLKAKILAKKQRKGYKDGGRFCSAQVDSVGFLKVSGMKRIAFLAACLAAGCTAAAGDLELVQLPYGLTVSIPSGWYVHDTISADSIADVGARMAPQLMDRENDQKERLLVSQDRQKDPTMIVRVTRVPLDSSEGNQDSITNMSNRDLLDVADWYRQKTASTVVKASSFSASTARFKDLWMLHISYDRQSVSKWGGQWRVSIYQLPLDGYLTMLTISHRKGDQKLISLAKQIRDSFDIKGSRKKYPADDPAFMNQFNKEVRSWKFPYRMDSATVRTGARVVENKRLVFYHELDDQFVKKLAQADLFEVRMNIRNSSCSDKTFAEVASYFRDGITQAYSTKSGREVLRVNATCR